MSKETANTHIANIEVVDNLTKTSNLAEKLDVNFYEKLLLQLVP